MIKIKEAIIVEGKYDRMRLASIFDTAIIETGGFRVFTDKEKQAVIRRLAQTRGIVLLTDSDSAGFVIRGYLKGIADGRCVKQAYIPEIKGKESRKSEPSKQGLLGVEGMSDDVIVEAVMKSGVTAVGESAPHENEITKMDFYEMGLSGRDNSAQLRQRLLRRLGFPQYMTANSLLSAVRIIYTKQELQNELEKLG